MAIAVLVTLPIFVAIGPGMALPLAHRSAAMARTPIAVVLEMLVLPGKEQPRRARGVRQLLISPSSLRSLCPLW